MDELIVQRAGLSIPEIVRKYGWTKFRDVEDVVAEVKWHIDALAPGGGYVVSSCNHMLNVRPEVLIAMFETACEYGRYK